MAPHSSTLAWKIPWMEEPGRLQSMGSLRVRHDWATSLSRFTFMHWRRKWQSTPVFLPGESQGRRSLVSCHLWGRTESDTTEATQEQQDRGRRRFHRKDMAYSRSHRQQAANQGLNSCLFRPKPTSHTALKIRKQAEFPSLFLALMVHMPGE